MIKKRIAGILTAILFRAGKRICFDLRPVSREIMLTTVQIMLYYYR